MDELPSEAKALLELARDGHDPPEDGARARVRQRLVVALTVPAAFAVSGGGGMGSGAASGASSSAGKGISGVWLGAKGWVVAAVLAVGVGGTTLFAWNGGPHRSAAPVPHVSEARPTSDAPDPTLAVRVGQPGLASPSVDPSAVAVAPVSRHPERSAPAPVRGAMRGGLGQEMELLSRAARLVAQRDVAGARALLDQHRRRFESSQLREEREGLMVLVQCIEQPVAARQRARLFVASAPASVLVARIEKACALGASEQREEAP